MAKNKVADAVEQLVAPVIQQMELELVDVEYVKEGGNWYLRIFIDKPGGVDLDDCQAVSQRVDELLDEADPISQAYLLEVSSPGIERPLKKTADFKRYEGHMVNVTTFAPLNGQKQFSGLLNGADENNIVIYLEGSETVIPMEQVASARLAVEF